MISKDPVQENVLEAIRRILQLCRSSQDKQPDESVEMEITSIEYIQDRVRENWPLSGDLKRDIYIGPFAARNLADWAMPLAHYIMFLDDVLKDDGKGVERLLAEMLQQSTWNHAATTR